MESKNKDPAFLFYSSDFLTGTMLMSDEQVGMYIKLMCLQHQKGHLKEKDMLNICKRHDEDVFSKFVTDDEGNYYNVRLEQEIEKRKKYSESRRNNRLSKSKEEKSDEDMSDTCQSYVPHMENENINININENIYKNIIDYLNGKCNADYKTTNRETKDLIKARLNEKFTEDDFKKVIDVKAAEWLNTDMAQYLRPETLFGSKFESYLNQKKVTKQQQIKSNRFHNFPQQHVLSEQEMDAIADKKNKEKLKKLGIENG